MAELEPGSVFAGHRIEGIAGSGGMGVVYAATDLRLQRKVAIKVIRSNLETEGRFQERFERECALAAQVNHPSVVQIYSAGEVDGAPYVTMAFIEGTDLGKLIEERGRLDLELVSTVADSIGGALDAAHKGGLVHRDVKPGNVLVGDLARGEVFLTDFGLTREFTSETRLTATGALIGTLDYMAPEQFEDERLDPRTDIYAFGCVVHEALTGKVPFPATGPVAKMFAHTKAERPSIREQVPELPEALDLAVQKAMAVNRGERFETAGELASAISAAAGTGDAATVVATVGAAAPVLGSTQPYTPQFEAPEAEADAEATQQAGVAATASRPAGDERATAKIETRREGPNLAAIALAGGAIAIAAVIAVLTLGGGDPGGVTPGEGGGGPSALAGSGSDDSGQDTGGSDDSTSGSSGDSDDDAGQPIEVDLPIDAVAEVSNMTGGVIEEAGYERRVELVELRSDATGAEAEAQALDELIVNRWLRGEAESRGITFSEAENFDEQTSPQYAGEVANLIEVGHDAAGVRLNTDARLAAEELFGEDSAAVAALTSGYDSADYGELAGLIEEWRPLTVCATDPVEPTPLCSNGPDPRP